MVQLDISKIKTILKVCNIYESCSVTEGPEISVGHPIQLSDTDIMYAFLFNLIIKYNNYYLPTVEM